MGVFKPSYIVIVSNSPLRSFSDIEDDRDHDYGSDDLGVGHQKH